MTAPGGTRVAIVANGAPMASCGERDAFAACGCAVYCDRLPLGGAGVPPAAFIVGDGDTLGGRAVLTDVPFYPDPDQETNDLTKAFRAAVRLLSPERIDWFCVTGGREDHTLANLSLIAGYGMAGRVLTNSGAFRVLLAGTHTFACGMGDRVSFISFVPQRVTASGVRWPVENLLLDTLWRATLNRTAAETLTVRCESTLLVYIPWRHDE